ncbi:MAG TPA: pyridoxine 5'-phosphate synthase [Rhizobacter sp.]|nr:pyridoxine 5'-phosphate synthase [Rhizobacter sp.]
MNPLLTTGLDAHRGFTALSVNVNLVAQIRNRRPLGFPSVAGMAAIALRAGAQGITIHPRPDQRHIRTHDVFELAELMQQWPQAEFNVEGNPLHNLMGLLRELAAKGQAPQQCTFVPDDESQPTSDHGWQFPHDAQTLAPLIAEAKALGIRVSLFMDPLPEAMAAVREVGADRVELYTESYARAHGTPEGPAVLAQFAAAAQAARHEGLGINAGHDLNRSNLADFLRGVTGVQEVSIGHALIADTLELGMEATVRAYLRCIREAA